MGSFFHVFSSVLSPDLQANFYFKGTKLMKIPQTAPSLKWFVQTKRRNFLLICVFINLELIIFPSFQLSKRDINSKNIYHLQLRTNANGRLLDSLCKWGHFERAKTTLKMLLASWFLVCFLKRFRSLNAENLGSVGQRAANLPAIKLWEWFDPVWSRTRADRLECVRGWKADFFFRPPTLIVSNFEAL